MKNVCIINGHPDPSEKRLVHALCSHAEAGAREAGHTVSRIDIGALDFPLLSSADAFAERPPEVIQIERAKLGAADHIILAFPLWLGGLPAKTKAFFEQAARAEYFITGIDADQAWPKKLMTGKSARILVTMGMPSLVYRFGMDAGALKALERGMLGLSGFHPIHHTIIGGVGNLDEEDIQKLFEQAERFGRELD